MNLKYFSYVPGVGQVTAEDTLRREIIHLVRRLFTPSFFT